MSRHLSFVDNKFLFGLLSYWILFSHFVHSLQVIEMAKVQQSSMGVFHR